DESVRNEAAFRLARIYFQKGQLNDAMHALQRIQGTVPPQIVDDVEFLRANILMATGQPSEAVKVLKQLRSGEDLAGFVAYNLGIALLEDGRQQEAIEQLDNAGQLSAGDPAGLAIRDNPIWCLAPCCSSLGILSGQDSHWTESGSRDRSQ